MESQEKVYTVKVDGQRVPTWQMFWEQMMAQSCRIDRAVTIAWAALAVGLADLVILVWLIMSAH